MKLLRIRCFFTVLFFIYSLALDVCLPYVCFLSSNPRLSMEKNLEPSGQSILWFHSLRLTLAVSKQFKMFCLQKTFCFFQGVLLHYQDQC
uniref:Uncharacterized protein n=1 Tax=Zosterops lateralis melanops TaxID=1220523 RepID=A0A8D2PZV9_ZOSLA